MLNIFASKKLDKYILITLSFSTIFVLIYNINNYEVNFGYDADAHIRYVNAFAMYLPNNFRLPLSSETYEYFSPPVGYIFSALVQVICRNVSNAADLVSFCVPIYGKLTQVFQSVLFLISMYFYMRAINIFLNLNKKLNLSVFIMISILTANYRTISMIRGEPYILFFLSIIIYLFSKFTNSNFDIKRKDLFLFGLSLGLMGLSRQWGLLIYPAFSWYFFSLKNLTEGDISIFYL